MNIAVLVSGGVDSSVALALLKERGHQVVAFYLKIWLEDELAYLGEQCPWEEDLDFVRRTCEKLSVPLHVIPLQREYHETVVAHVIAQIKAGKTPNPDILCNNKIKFGFFIDMLVKNFESFDFIATGHYAQISHANSFATLCMAPDTIKDQTYFLAQLTLKQLSKVLFPIGHLTKKEVRELAQTYDLPSKLRKDSQGICFLGKLKFSDFIAHYVGIKKGKLIEFETQTVLGTHDGYWYYTIGQRHSIKLSGGPWYVVAKNIEYNIIYISRTYYQSDKKRNSFSINECNWLNPVSSGNYKVKMRHGPELLNADIVISQDNQSAVVSLSENDQGIAPGQFCVIYKNNQCVGSGVIIE